MSVTALNPGNSDITPLSQRNGESKMICPRLLILMAVRFNSSAPILMISPPDHMTAVSQWPMISTALHPTI
jgi:hypothetical protein